MKRAEMNRVRLQVRRFILQHPDFTMDELARATGANRESLRTEIARLLKEKIIKSKSTSREPSHQGGRGKAPVGAPPRLYQLVQNEQNLDALRQSILGFYDDQYGRLLDRPTGSVFRELYDMLDRAIQCDAEERQDLLIKADSALKFVSAMHKEFQTTENFRAHLKMEELRIACLKNECGDNAPQFQQLATFFKKIGNPEAAQRAEEFASFCRNCEREQSDDVGYETKAYESMTAGSPNPLVIVGKNLVRKLYKLYTKALRDYEELQQRHQILESRLETFKKVAADFLQHHTTGIKQLPAFLPAETPPYYTVNALQLIRGEPYTRTVSPSSGTLLGTLRVLFTSMLRPHQSEDSLMGGRRHRKEFLLEAVQLCVIEPDRGPLVSLVHRSE